MKRFFFNELGKYRLVYLLGLKVMFVTILSVKFDKLTFARR